MRANQLHADLQQFISKFFKCEAGVARILFYLLENLKIDALEDLGKVHALCKAGQSGQHQRSYLNRFWSTNSEGCAGREPLSLAV